MILLIDNYDSFVYNLARYFSILGCECQVFRNDSISIQDIEEMDPSHIVISPGPCTPQEAGISISVVEHFASQKPILGVCLGHQAIAQAYGSEIIRAQKPVHGKASYITHDGTGLFQALKNPLQVGRYHSLVVDEILPRDLEATAYSSDKVIMGIRHKKYPIYGVQFHPESILTEEGLPLLQNFLSTVSIHNFDANPELNSGFA